MYPTKSKKDFMSEMCRLFPRNSDDDAFSMPLSPTSSQSVAISSSSNDTSPETFPDISGRNNQNRQFIQNDGHFNQNSQFIPHEGQLQFLQNEGQFDQNLSLFSQSDFEQYRLLNQNMQGSFEAQNTPYTTRHRPIIGRRLTTDNPIPEDNSMYKLFPVQKLFELTPRQNCANTSSSPEVMKMGPGMPSLSPRQNLSPRMTDWSPRTTDLSPRMTDLSPRMTDLSPRMLDLSPRQKLPLVTNVSQSEMSLITSMSNINLSPSNTELSQMYSQLPDLSRVPDLSPKRNMPPVSPKYPPFKEPFVGKTFRPNVSNKMCTFCRKNGETPLVYMEHSVKEKMGNRTVVTCPILRSHVCSACGATGDKAHTISYCPLLRSANNGQPLQSATITLKNTRVKSNGRRRY